MGVERFYTKDGMPAFVRVTMRVSGQDEAAVRIVYPRAYDFTKLWDREPIRSPEIVDSAEEV